MALSNHSEKACLPYNSDHNAIKQLSEH